ncbi:rhomboid family intramembrane serine protease [Paenirhodobacter sp. CAU 1674]|jgi:membrane associated rhomboid family serine protease|uniref:rhomboid family intramembrane serine protease n=1 Tax=Paenirhodobacter sp. CAU 1674 TaxID=3032596 RepID=UPI0023DCB777|nr:rhomboid family intramembrane serine protease [Paenirhodobacter sp. CAU 1674]MDF2140940.1 rhomboid family intramembrane serine protease [Paenirhodobacter sp. CAU 1674]
MFPIRDHNPSSRTPYVTWGIIALNVILFVLTMPGVGGMESLWADWALYPAAITHGAYLQGLVTHMFLHAGLLHIAGNMLFLWVFGDNLEDQLGHIGFALFYLAAGLAAAAAQILTDPSSTVPMVGASGAIAGVMGGYMLMFPRARVDVLLIFIVFFKVLPIPAWVVLGIWFALQLLNGTTAGMADGVAYWAHAGGFVAGLLLMVPHWRRMGGVLFWGQTHGRPPHPEIDYSRSNIPVVRRRRR